MTAIMVAMASGMVPETGWTWRVLVGFEQRRGDRRQWKRSAELLQEGLVDVKGWTGPPSGLHVPLLGLHMALALPRSAAAANPSAS